MFIHIWTNHSSEVAAKDVHVDEFSSSSYTLYRSLSEELIDSLIE